MAAGSAGSAPDPFTVLAASRYVSLTTYRKDGTPVATPVWVVALEGELWVWTNLDAGKVKRLRRSPRAALAPCRVCGEALGESVPARGRVVPTDQVERVLPALIAEYGWQGRLTLLPGTLGRLIGRPPAVGAVALTLE